MSSGSCFPLLYREDAVVHNPDGPQSFLRRLLPTELAQSVTLLVHVRWVPGSILGRDNDYPDREWYVKSNHERFLPHPFQFIIL
jgi:hypothetical protein